MTSFGSVGVVQTFVPLLVVHNDLLAEMGSKVDLVLLLGAAVQRNQVHSVEINVYDGLPRAWLTHTLWPGCRGEKAAASRIF